MVCTAVHIWRRLCQWDFLANSQGLGKSPVPAARAHGTGKAWLEALEQGWHGGSWGSEVPQPLPTSEELWDQPRPHCRAPAS